MKKKYMNPVMEIVKIETHQMLASSVGINSTPVDANDAEGRFYDFDDDF